MKNIKITAPEGYEIDKVNSTFENIVFKPIKKELPKSWEELNDIPSGWFVDLTSNVQGVNNQSFKVIQANKSVFATKEQAEASLALAQLSQLREVYRDGWKPQWTNNQEKIYIIEHYNGEINCDWCYYGESFLSFQSAEVRDLFIENFRSLIEQAKPLMS